MQKVTYNDTQQLFVIQCDGGYSCYGLENAKRELEALIAWLEAQGVPAPLGNIAEPLALYDTLTQVREQAQKLCETKNIKCNIDLHPSLNVGQKVHYTCAATGKKRSFTVGISTGWKPIHLAIKTSRSSGGQAISKNTNLAEPLYL